MNLKEFKELCIEKNMPSKAEHIALFNSICNEHGFILKQAYGASYIIIDKHLPDYVMEDPYVSFSDFLDMVNLELGDDMKEKTVQVECEFISAMKPCNGLLDKYRTDCPIVPFDMNNDNSFFTALETMDSFKEKLIEFGIVLEDK